jgi:AraC family transcriptional regulator of arabinose operon
VIDHEAHPTVWLPESVVDEAARRPLTRRLIVAAAGRPHLAEPMPSGRPNGADYAVVTTHTRGGGWIEIGGVRHAVFPGAVSVFPIRVGHSYRWSGDPWWGQSWFTLIGDDVDDILRAIGATPETPVLRTVDTGLTIRLVDSALALYATDTSPAALLRTSGLAWRILTQIAVERTRPMPGEPLEVAMRTIAENPARDVRVSELAASVGISRSRLQARFQAATGGGVIEYLTGIRMANARRLLDETRETIAGIAATVGYPDAYYFSRRFRRMHGMSPREYRRRPRP